jgi:hypothetical protein
VWVVEAAVTGYLEWAPAGYPVMLKAADALLIPPVLRPSLGVNRDARWGYRVRKYVAAATRSPRAGAKRQDEAIWLVEAVLPGKGLVGWQPIEGLVPEPTLNRAFCMAEHLATAHPGDAFLPFRMRPWRYVAVPTPRRGRA